MKIKNRLVFISIASLLMVSLIAVGVYFVLLDESNNSKILIEYKSGGAIAVGDSIDSPSSDVYSYDENFAMQILFNYKHYNDALYESRSVKEESYVEYSKKYHTGKNQEFLKKIDTKNYDVFVSEYTPYVFFSCRGETNFDQVYEYAKSISDEEFIAEIRIFPTDIYNLDLENMNIVKNEESVSNIESESQRSTYSADLRPGGYENFPVGTPYKGSGIKIGVLDTGIFNTSHSNFSDIYTEIVYDTYTVNNADNNSQHPTWVASVLGGKYGYASAASIYYVDVNSETGYVGIERLINKGCSIVNMSISAVSCNTNGEYNTGFEGYLDYIYTSTKVIMVACASNNLDKEGTGGYVALPALCANVISVGSVTNDGVPSVFSSYNRKNDVDSNPNIVAVGDSRVSTGIGDLTGTSYSTPAVTGALALYFEKYGVKELPAVLAVLSATADDSIIDKSVKTINIRRKNSSGDLEYTGETIVCTNGLKSNGSRERTGAGMLDVTALLNYSNTLINYEITFTSTEPVELKDIYLTAGQTVKIALAWQRNATLTVDSFLWWDIEETYSSDTMADFELELFNSSGSNVAHSWSGMTNVEIVTYTVRNSGYYTITARPYANYADTHNINYAYFIE